MLLSMRLLREEIYYQTAKQRSKADTVPASHNHTFEHVRKHGHAHSWQLSLLRVSRVQIQT